MPSLTTYIEQIPRNFLQVHDGRLRASAARRRSMGDLKRGLDNLNGMPFVASLMVDGYRHDSRDAQRHVRRGASLTWLLLEDSTPNLASLTRSDTAIAHILDAGDLSPQPNPTRDNFTAARSRLTDVRLGEKAGVLGSAVDAVLAKAAIGGSFETAVGNLTGSGLEEPTRLLDAKYGAALCVLGLGVIASRK